MNSPEHNEQVALFNWAKYFEDKHPVLGMMFAIPNGGHRHINVAKKMKAEGVKAGVPDIFLAVPGEDTDWALHGLFIEMKIMPNKPTDNQKTWLDKLRDQDYLCKICYSWLEAAYAICDYLQLDPAEYGLGELKWSREALND